MRSADQSIRTSMAAGAGGWCLPALLSTLSVSNRSTYRIHDDIHATIERGGKFLIAGLAYRLSTLIPSEVPLRRLFLRQRTHRVASEFITWNSRWAFCFNLAFVSWHFLWVFCSELVESNNHRADFSSSQSREMKTFFERLVGRGRCSTCAC